MSIHQGGRLEYFINKQGKSKEELARLSGISKGSFFSYLKLEKIPSEKLEKICNVLEIDYVSEFVIPKKNTKIESSNTLNEDLPPYGLLEINKALRSENESLKAQIELLKDMISMLKKQLKIK